MMLGLGSVSSGAGGNSSSPPFSNLSALAPPFSIERLNPVPNSKHPIMQYPEPPCAIDPIWQYTQPSAPRSELALDSVSMGMPSMPVTDVYRFSASMSTSPSATHWPKLSPAAKTSGTAFAYGGGVEPYYSPYAPTVPLPDDDGPRYDAVPASVLDLPSQIDYIQGLYDLEYGPRWVDPLGSEHGKQAEKLEVGRSFSSEKMNFSGSHSYNNHLNGGDGIEYGSKNKNDTSVSCEQFMVSDRDLLAAYTGVRRMEDKPCLEQNLSFLPSDSNKLHITAGNSTYSDSRFHCLSSEIHNNFSGYQSTCSTHKNPVRSIGSLFNYPVPATRSSAAVVIRPPPVINGVLGQIGSSRSTAYNDSVGGAGIKDFDLTNTSNRNDLGQKSNSEIKEDCYDTDLLNLSKQDNSQILVSPSVKDFSTPLHTKDTFECNNKAIFLSQFSNLNVPNGSDTVQVVASAEVSSDSVDRHNLSIDSPCWKGASASQFSSLDVDDSCFSYSTKIVDEFYGFEHEEQEAICSATDSMRTAVCAGEGNKNQETEYALDAMYPTRESKSFDDAKAAVKVSAMTRSIDQINKDPSMPTKESGLPNNLKNVSDMNNSNSKHFLGEVDTGLTLIDVSEGDIAVHAAEKVLASPSSQEDTAERIKLQPDPKLDTSTIIKAIHNLSELLCFHLANNASILEVKNSETLKLVISNLDSCLSKKIVEPTNEQDLNYPIGAASEIGMSHNMGTILDTPHKTNEFKNSRIQRDNWSMYDEGGNCDVSGKKDEKSPVFSSLRDELYLTADDEMVKAIKNVLDENFNVDEETHSQAPLFKSLWLEAEAKLCSITYKARFDRMKLEMEKTKPKLPLGNEDDVDMISKIHISTIPNTGSKSIFEAHDGIMAKPVIESSSFSRTSVHTDDIETSVMSRFNILKSREADLKLMNKEEQKNSAMAAGDDSEEKTPETGLGDKDHLDTCIRDESEVAISLVGPRPHLLHRTVDPSEGTYLDGSGNESVSYVANDQLIHSFYDDRMINQRYSGWHGSSSSWDWEHVLKDDFAWKK